MIKHDSKKTIEFSPSDISEIEIQEVVDSLKSGWITTGPKTKEFERKKLQDIVELIKQYVLIHKQLVQRWL